MLTLNTFNLQLDYSGSGWTSGSNLLLFSYVGTITGTPTLGTVTLGTGIASIGGISTSGNNVYIDIVQLTVVPEPSAAFLLMASFGSLMVWKLRRRKA